MAKATSTTKDTDLGMKKLIKEFKKFNNKPHIKIGMIGEGKGSEVHKETTLTNAAIGTFHEFGTKDEDENEVVPERSFLRSTVDENNKKYSDIYRKQVSKSIDKKQDFAYKILELIGQKIVLDIQGKIRAGLEPPLKRKRSKKGRVDSETQTPLIDTGQLIKSITYIVVD